MDFKRRKKGFGGGKIFEHLRRRTAVERETYHLRQEQKRLRTEIELAQCEAETQRRTAGLSAFEFWEAGTWEKSEQELAGYFEKIKEKNEDIAKKSLEIEGLEEQIRRARQKAPEEAVYLCPACGASFRHPANFCRLCGFLMAQTSENSDSEILESSEVPDQEGTVGPSSRESAEVLDRPEEQEREITAPSEAKTPEGDS